MKLVAPEPYGKGAAAEFLEKYGSDLNWKEKEWATVETHVAAQGPLQNQAG